MTKLFLVLAILFTTIQTARSSNDASCPRGENDCSCPKYDEHMVDTVNYSVASKLNCWSKNDFGYDGDCRKVCAMVDNSLGWPYRNVEQPYGQFVKMKGWTHWVSTLGPYSGEDECAVRVEGICVDYTKLCIKKDSNGKCLEWQGRQGIHRVPCNPMVSDLRSDRNQIATYQFGNGSYGHLTEGKRDFFTKVDKKYCNSFNYGYGTKVISGCYCRIWCSYVGSTESYDDCYPTYGPAHELVDPKILYASASPAPNPSSSPNPSPSSSVSPAASPTCEPGTSTACCNNGTNPSNFVRPAGAGGASRSIDWKKLKGLQLVQRLIHGYSSSTDSSQNALTNFLSSILFTGPQCANAFNNNGVSTTGVWAGGGTVATGGGSGGAGTSPVDSAGCCPCFSGSPTPNPNTSPDIHTRVRGEVYDDTSIDFGRVSVSNSKSLYLSVFNTGEGEAKNCYYSITGQDSKEFTAEGSTSYPCNNPFDSIASSQNRIECGLRIDAKPLSSGSKSAALSIKCDGNYSIARTIQLETGLSLTLTPNPFDFGSVNESSDSAIQEFTLNNNSTSDGRNCNVTFSLPDFIVVGGSISDGNKNADPAKGAFAITSSTNGKIQIKAKPTAIGLRTAILKVDCAGENSPSGLVANGSTSATIKVTGVAVQAAKKASICPPDYETIDLKGKSECRPKLPLPKTRKTSDFFRDSSNGYPVCGKGRIPVTANGSPLDVSTSNVPNSNKKLNSYLYATENGASNPKYLYGTIMSCACGFKDYQPSNSANTTGEELTSNKIPTDVFSKINGQTSSGSVDYSPVAFGKTGKDDGRIGTNFNQCGCPNLNEKLVAVNDSFPSTTPQGATCESDVDPSNRVLVEYDSTLHLGQVLNLSGEPKDSSGNLLTQVMLPVANGSLATQVHKRKIWACAPGYILNLKSKRCEFNESSHACGKSASGVMPSAVSGRSTLTTTSELDALFDSTVNKKLACCINAFSKGVSNFKFDCIDNSAATNDFNSLWTSGDNSVDGGQLNAIVLNGASGPVSGFYTLAGARCNEYSEFGGEILKGRIDPRSKTVVSQNGTIPHPSGAAYIALKTNLNKTTPQSVSDRLHCPIVVMAAIKAKCGANLPLPAVQTTLVDTSNQTRCSSAENIQIHVRVEQVTEIVGKPVLKIQDSVMNPGTAGSLSVKGLIDTSNGGSCPPSTTRVGDQCIAK